MNCPRCNGTEVQRVVYGNPSPRMGEQGTRDGVVYNGTLTEDSPAWHCAGCGHKFGTYMKECVNEHVLLAG